jgi:hypothetical protein
MECVGDVAFLAGVVHKSRCAGFYGQKLRDKPWPWLSVQRGAENAMRTCVSGAVAGAAGLVVGDAVWHRKFRRRMSGRKRSWIDEAVAQLRNSEHDQQCSASEHDDRAIDPASNRAQGGDGSAFGNWSAATAIGQRSAFAFSTGTIATPAAFGFTRHRFQRRNAPCRGLTTTAPIRSERAGFPLGGAATDPTVVRPGVIL